MAKFFYSSYHEKRCNNQRYGGYDNKADPKYIISKLDISLFLGTPYFFKNIPPIQRNQRIQDKNQQTQTTNQNQVTNHHRYRNNKQHKNNPNNNQTHTTKHSLR